MVKYYVGNLTFNVSDKELYDHFSGLGEVVSAKVVRDRTTGNSKGFGFVELQKEIDSELINKQRLDGRNLSINPAQ